MSFFIFTSGWLLLNGINRSRNPMAQLSPHQVDADRMHWNLGFCRVDHRK